jgi:putative photosynthetic complex assembly protein 2
MSEYGLPVLYTLLVWWASTGLVLFLDGMPARTFRWSMLGATLALLVALYGLAQTSHDASVSSAYWSFTCGVVVWGWQEMSFLMGFLTGPRRHACPERCSGWRHFGHGIQAILYHEVAIIVMGVAVVVLSWNAPNQTGMWAYLVLWTMRQSAKLNLFLGVRNLSEEFLPDHLRYMKCFFRRKPMNVLFPFSVTGATVVAGMLVDEAIAPGTTPFAAVSVTLVAALLGLAILEHWLLVLPLPSTALWKWSLKPRERAAGSGSGIPHEASVHDTGPLLATRWQSAVPLYRARPGD